MQIRERNVSPIRQKKAKNGDVMKKWMTDKIYIVEHGNKEANSND